MKTKLKDGSASVQNANFDLNVIIQEVVRTEVEKVIADIRAEIEAATKSANAPRTYTREQVCESLKCSQPTLSRMMNKGVIHFVKRGKRTLFLAREFDEMLQQGKIGKYM